MMLVTPSPRRRNRKPPRNAPTTPTTIFPTRPKPLPFNRLPAIQPAAEIYRQVEQLDEVVESIVIGQDWDGDVRVVLFVVLREGASLDDDLRDRIKDKIRVNTTPRHVPARIVQVADIPRTKNGKIVELAVRNVVHGREVKNKDALANPEALELFRGVALLET